jgi:outer membrane protein assembly factor BamB
MFMRAIVRCSVVVAVVAVNSTARAEEGVDLTAKFTDGRHVYVEIDSEVMSKSTSPMGNFDMTLRIKNGVLEAAASQGNRTKLSLTVDRAAFTFDSSMGPSFYDSDIPDEEQSQQWEQLMAPQIGMTMNIELDADNNVTKCAGMEAIVKKIDEAAAGNMFWSFEKPRYTDEKQKLRWHNQSLSAFPNKPVRQGDTWSAPYAEEFAELKDFHFDCTYKLDRIAEKDGRTLAEISFEGKAPDRQYESEGMMPIGHIKVEKATLSGTATIDVDRGELIRREDHAEIAFSGTIGQGEKAPKSSTTKAIKRTYLIKTLADRRAEKQANTQLAAAKKKEAEKAGAERRRRFASAKQVDVITAIRQNPIGIPASWPQWGGPHGDFKAGSTGLADKWPDRGPRKQWSRDLGDGYSSIACDAKRLYTMYRPTDEEKNKTDEYVVALDPQTGETIWEYKYQAPFVDGMDASFGRGPHSTPLVLGDRLFAVGSMVRLMCLDKNTGSVLWERDLREDFNASHMMYGYGASALAYGDTVILPIGGEGQAVVAFKQSDGSVAWKNQDFGPTHASLSVVNSGGADQLILFSKAEVAGLDPKSGELLWRIEHPTEWGANISTPVWGQDGTLFISSAYGMGSRGIQLSESGGRPKAEELWHNRKMKIHHGNGVRVGNFVYGSSGDFGAVFYAAVDVKSGEFAWKNRDVGKATSIYADGKMIILNEDGKLFLARASPGGLDILGEMQLFDGRAWTAPILVGKTLFVRDRKKIMALDLG